jgi:hypothetical protein
MTSSIAVIPAFVLWRLFSGYRFERVARWNPENVIFVLTRDYLKALTEPHVIAALSNDETGDDADNIAS